MQYEFVWCNSCAKLISDDEYVVNWGSCSDCFDAYYLLYLECVPDQLELWPGSSGVEQWSEKPRVDGSRPSPATIF